MFHGAEADENQLTHNYTRLKRERARKKPEARKI
jgi:hypothetical protein